MKIIDILKREFKAAAIFCHTVSELHWEVSMRKKETLQCFSFCFMDNIAVRMIKVCACIFLCECVSFKEKKVMKNICCITVFLQSKIKIKERVIRLLLQTTYKGELKSKVTTNPIH